jgi:hypothetical protein
LAARRWPAREPPGVSSLHRNRVVAGRDCGARSRVSDRIWRQLCELEEHLLEPALRLKSRNRPPRGAALNVSGGRRSPSETDPSQPTSDQAAAARSPGHRPLLSGTHPNPADAPEFLRPAPGPADRREPGSCALVVGNLARIDDVRRLADQAREHGPIDAWCDLCDLRSNGRCRPRPTMRRIAGWAR